MSTTNKRTGVLWRQLKSGMVVEKIRRIKSDGSDSFGFYEVVKAGNGSTWMSAKGDGYRFGCTTITDEKLAIAAKKWGSWEKL